MSGVTEAFRTGGVKTSLGPDILILKRLRGEERLGRPFLFHVELSSEDHGIAFDEVVGHPMTVWLELEGGGNRYFSGHATSFRLVGSDREGNAKYVAELRPWYWLLSRSAECRIFQEITVPDLIKKVFRDMGFSDFNDRLSGTYRTWEYCVQYRETHLSFLSRLMEQEGIYFYFEHEEGKCTLVLADSLGSHDALPENPEIEFSGDERRRAPGPVIDVWEIGRSVSTGAVEMRDYDFTAPSQDTTAKSSMPANTGFADAEVYDYPGEYAQTSDGETYARVRLEELQADQEMATGRTNVRAMVPGALFTLTDHPRSDQNHEYLIASTQYNLSMPDSSESGGGSEGQFSTTFSAVDSDWPWRSARTTPKPGIQGPQTAVVVGPSGEEIYTDEHGRVKLQFHWDREGTNDENSSCWVRVSQVWAGAEWGSIHLPRIGQEVIVEFLEGDPDRPIITGRVYNAEKMPPYALPDNMTQSGMKTRSTKEGNAETFNELRFEDKKDEEEIYLHAEKNFNRVVENDDTLKVGFDDQDPGDRTVEIYHDQKVVVGNSETVDIGYELMDPGDQTVKVYNDRTVTIGNADTLTVEKGDQTVTVDQGKQDIQVKLGDHILKVGAGKSTYEATTSIEIKCGASSIKLEPAKITIKAPQVMVQADVQLEAKAAMTTVKGDAMLTLKGGVTMIN